MRQELERLLDTHRAQRPEMQPQDYYKLLYQREFGCGHTAPAPETAGRHLMEEYARAAGLPGADAVPEHVKGAALPGCVEDIGNGLCRIYLNGAWSREVLRLLGRVFCATAREHKGETACFAAALDGLAHWADAVLPPRDAQTLRRQTGTLRAAGCPAVHHSAAYRGNMRPTTAWCAGVMQTPGPLCCWPSAFWNPFPRRPCAAGHRRALRQRKKHVGRAYGAGVRVSGLSHGRLFSAAGTAHAGTSGPAR